MFSKANTFEKGGAMTAAEVNRPIEWVEAMTSSELSDKGKAVVKLDGKQILLWQSGEAIYACNNRCPHEGFPLAEGTIADGCVLTCNWHNWKFDLESGETLVGGDALRLYPVKLDAGRVYLDLADPPPEELRAKAVDGLKEAFGEHEYERMAREVARYETSGGDPVDLLDYAFTWAADRFEFGMTHAQAGAPDWLALRAKLPDDRHSDRMIPLLEIIGNLSWDAIMQAGPFPFPGGTADRFDADALVDAIEREDEALAMALTRAALRDDGPGALKAPLQRASLRHYQNFGHTPIYFDKTFELLGHLAPDTAPAVLLPLVRTLCKGAREDLIPEFRSYAPALDVWDGEGIAVPEPGEFRKQGVRPCLDKIAKAGGRIDALYDTLFYAACDAMLHFDANYRSHIDKPIQQNVDWLDFTHAATHLNASRKICETRPELWPNALLQTGCFLGRNATFVDWDQDTSRWEVDDADGFFADTFDQLLDHGEPVYIYPVHTLKLTTALQEEIARRPNAPWVPVALAALNRYLHEPAKKKHMRRVATQALKFVEAQG